MATIFIGNLGVSIYRAAAIKQGLKTWHKYKVKLNSAYTPLAMMKAAGEITGQKFKPYDYLAAIKALDDWLEAQKAEAIRTGAIK